VRELDRGESEAAEQLSAAAAVGARGMTLGFGIARFFSAGRPMSRMGHRARTTGRVVERSTAQCHGPRRRKRADTHVSARFLTFLSCSESPRDHFARFSARFSFSDFCGFFALGF
jgi:hypothetical protein